MDEMAGKLHASQHQLVGGRCSELGRAQTDREAGRHQEGEDGGWEPGRGLMATVPPPPLGPSSLDKPHGHPVLSPPAPGKAAPLSSLPLEGNASYQVLQRC